MFTNYYGDKISHWNYQYNFINLSLSFVYLKK